ncbi:MAG: HAMP domain-containing histidine kinase [Betaproteobacteria bacterium]|nr:HAMP domain-containing histidine kinase [Betaproteobacteria bacterium]
MPAERLHLRNIHNTSTFRLTILLGSSAMVGILLLLLLIYSLTAQELNARNDRILRSEAERLLLAPESSLPTKIAMQLSHNTSDLNYIALLSPNGEFLSGNLREVLSLPIGQPTERASLITIDNPLRLLAIKTYSGKILIVGRDISPLVNLRSRIITILAYSGLIIVLFFLVAGFASSIGPLRRVDRLQQVARTIAQGRLDARMPVQDRGDELDLLAATVNYMIEEVERTVSQIKAVTDAAAHDLRTPLTRARNQLYRISRQADLDEMTVTHIENAMAELDSVVARFAALMRISELETVRQTAGFASVSLAVLATSVAELYEPLAEDRGITFLFDADPAAFVFGDEKLLFEAVSNLVDNAIKFAPPGGRVALHVATGDGHSCVEVRDDGPGIATDKRTIVLRRFDRGSAPADVPGSGLGLSIVSAIVQLHHFSLEMDTGSPGLIVRIVAPSSQAPENG